METNSNVGAPPGEAAASTSAPSFLANFNPFDKSRPASITSPDFFASPAGGEYHATDSPVGFIARMVQGLAREARRTEHDYVAVRGMEFGHRVPEWMEEKNVAIDGKPLTEADRRQSWSHRYRKELDVAAAVQEVRAQRRFEADHDVISAYRRVRRFFGYEEPLDEEYARRKVESRYVPAADASSSPADDTGAHGAIVVPPREPVTLLTPWKALMTSVDTGRPLATVAREYRPQIDFYGIDSFLDSAPSLVWFSTKCGIAVGLGQGTIKAVQAINVDVQFLRASGVGVLSILNATVLASVVKWGGNMALLASAFVVGDRAVRVVKRGTLPAHESERRTTVNYVGGFACAGATTGVMPWWMLHDAHLAGRMAVSGVAVGATLGALVGVLLQRLVSLNVSRIDASSRQLRRYEALILRQREWVRHEREQDERANTVWW